MASTTTRGALPNFVAPIPQTNRFLFLDCVGGTALLGIFIKNITSKGQAHQLYEIMDVGKPLTGLNFMLWVIESFLFKGLMRGLFSLLFGAGTLLRINRLEKKNNGLLPDNRK